MKVGIITRHHMYHHGVILRVYALQTILDRIYAVFFFQKN